MATRLPAHTGTHRDRKQAARVLRRAEDVDTVAEQTADIIAVDFSAGHPSDITPDQFACQLVDDFAEHCDILVDTFRGLTNQITPEVWVSAARLAAVIIEQLDAAAAADGPLADAGLHQLVQIVDQLHAATDAARLTIRTVEDRAYSKVGDRREGDRLPDGRWVHTAREWPAAGLADGEALLRRLCSEITVRAAQGDVETRRAIDMALAQFTGLYNLAGRSAPLRKTAVNELVAHLGLDNFDLADYLVDVERPGRRTVEIVDEAGHLKILRRRKPLDTPEEEQT